MAGAVWEWPPSVCGRHHDLAVLARSAKWAWDSYIRFNRLAADYRTGVIVRPTVFYFSRRVEDDPVESAKLALVEQILPEFVHDAGLIDAHGVNPDFGMVDAYSYQAPSIDIDRYLVWLARQAQVSGVTVVRRRIRGPLAEQQDKLLVEFGADLIVNCSGLGARELACDPTMEPHGDGLVRLVADSNAMPRVTAVHVIANDPSTDDHDMAFVVPRGAGRLLLGGPVEPGEYDTGLHLDNYPPLRELRERCTGFLPILRAAQLDPLDSLRVGLQPYRKDGVRLQIEPGTRIVHNYGHGGAAVTLSWGCAQQVGNLAAGLLAQQGGFRDRRDSNSRAPILTPASP